MPTGNKVLNKMLDRLLAGLMSGPNMNCRPHKSRQRIDLTQLARLHDVTPEQTLIALLGNEKSSRTLAKVKLPRKAKADDPQSLPTEKAWTDQSALLAKLKLIADDARTYENDTGVHALSIGFPLLSLPPGSFAGASRNSTKRILAPIAFIPVTLLLKGGATPSVDLACHGEGADRVVPNSALLSWVEQQTGKPQAADAFEDEEGIDPWREIHELVKHVADAMQIEVPAFLKEQNERQETAPHQQIDPQPGDDAEGGLSRETKAQNLSKEPSSSPVKNLQKEFAADKFEQHQPDDTNLDEPAMLPDAADFAGEPPVPQAKAIAAGETQALKAEARTNPPTLENPLHLLAAPQSDDETEPAILLSAVLGLFPTAHQGLVRDTRAMLSEQETPAGPIQSFLSSGIDFDAPTIITPLPGPQATKSRTVRSERLAAAADPCQARAVALSREAAGLVIHGPPGTGKSQTITNIISDHLARGQRVLLVCEKRTALDVVADRLEHMGLGNLCGIVHDPQRDQRELYKSIHEQLAELTDAKLHPRAEAELEKVDAELQQLHDELTGFHNALMHPLTDGSASFHELMGRWMAEQNGDAPLKASEISGLTLSDLDKHHASLVDLFRRAQSVELSRNLWAKCAGITLVDFLARPMADLRTAMDRCQVAAERTDATLDPRIPPFEQKIPLPDQARLRNELAGQLASVIDDVLRFKLHHWAGATAENLTKASAMVPALERYLEVVNQGPVDVQLLAAATPMPTLSQLQDNFAKVTAYLEVAGTLKSMFSFKAKSDAKEVLARYKLPLDKVNAQRWIQFWSAVTPRIAIARLRAIDFVNSDEPAVSTLPPDEELKRWVQTCQAWFPLLAKLHQEPALQGVLPLLAKAIVSGESPDDLLDGLRLSPPRAEAIVHLDEQMTATQLIHTTWQSDFESSVRAGKTSFETVSALHAQLDTLEGVLRAQAARSALAPALGSAVDALLRQATDADNAMSTLSRCALSNEITRRLRADAVLQAFDAHQVESKFDRFRELDAQKKNLVRDVITHLWVSKQKARLLAATGSRLNTAGGEIRRRLTTRGEHAKRLRQVIAMGHGIQGGDPLFDLCPVWMASPETVAQIFPRSAVFDVVIFDEASQCRLEEALPVLTRGRRVVIAGDPNQLPPTRFFESGLVQSEDDEAETEQELFEHQQGEVEDLLAAALNLSIQQCYLDVHYRSRNADLIEFSNRNFYSSRLQAIPGHPFNRTKFSPLTLYRVDGIYNKRQNEAEADRVVQIVRDLLKRATPPSIGIACLNLPQRDLITKKLDDLAADDSDFAKRLAAARIRKGQGSFEGLFVKNLENVQGDERDDIIISTTYGPDTSGKFYRRFGPVGMAGGGRRLNVLVTRARNEVHLVTSIPAEAYRSLPVIPEGQSATGAWLLFAYLKYAEELSALYAHDNADPAMPASGAEKPAVVTNVRPSHSPSLFAKQLAESIAMDPRIGSDVHWGNEGFCVDLALHHPDRPGDVTVGVLCDGCRYPAADDPLEWDIFRTGVLTGQGWKLQRIWTPHFFRDPHGSVQAIKKNADEFVATEKPVDAIPTTNAFRS